MARQTKSIRWARALGALLLILAMTWGLGATAATLRSGNQPAGVSGPNGDMLTGSYDISEDAGVSDNIIRLINPAGCGNSGVPSGACASEIDLCAMIYLFDDDQEMGECCGCAITPNELQTFSVRTDLTNNWAMTNADSDSGVVQIISGQRNNPNNCQTSKGCNGGCDPTAADIPSAGLLGSISRSQLIGFSRSITELPLTNDGSAESTEAAYLPAQCGALIGNGSGGGVCNCAVTTSPFVSITAPANGAIVSGMVTVTVTTSPDVAFVRVFIDEVLLGTTPPLSFNWDTSTVSPGPHTISATAFGAGGTVLGNASIIVTVASGPTPTATETFTVATATPTPTPTETFTAATATPTPTPFPATVVSPVVLCPSAGATPVQPPGSAGNYTLLAGQSVTNTGFTTIIGNLGISPGSTLTPGVGFTVSGFEDLGNGNSLNGQNILNTAFLDAAGRSFSSIPGELGGTTLVGGVYRSDISSFSISASPLTLDAQGDPNEVWIFQMPSSTLTTVTGNVVLTNGAQGCNVFWQVGSSATLGTNTTFYGNILAKTSISLTTGALIPQGRALAENGSVTLQHNAIGGCTCP